MNSTGTTKTGLNLFVMVQRKNDEDIEFEASKIMGEECGFVFEFAEGKMYVGGEPTYDGAYDKFSSHDCEEVKRIFVNVYDDTDINSTGMSEREVIETRMNLALFWRDHYMYNGDVANTEYWDNLYTKLLMQLNQNGQDRATEKEGQE